MVPIFWKLEYFVQISDGFWQMDSICLDFICFQILDPIQNPNYLQANLILTIRKPD